MATLNYLDTTGLGKVWSKIKDYADPFIVTVTSTTSNGTTTYSADKTFTEITAAYNAGKVCFLKRTDGYYYGLSLINSTKIIFSQQFTAQTYEVSSIGSFTITSSNIITLNSHSVYGRTPIKNIYPRKTSIATINGTVPVTYMTGGNIEFNSTTATQAYTDGDLFWIGQYDLVKAITNISSGDTLIENTNYVVTTISDELKNGITPIIVNLSDVNIATVMLSDIGPSDIYEMSESGKVVLGLVDSSYLPTGLYQLVYSTNGSTALSENIPAEAKFFNGSDIITVTTSQVPSNQSADIAGKYQCDVETITHNPDWNETDIEENSYILNKPSIKSGDGENSVLIGQIEQDENTAIYQITISGDGNAITYNYTSDVNIENYNSFTTYLKVKTNGYRVTALDTTNHTITLDRTASYSAITSQEAVLYCRYKSAIGDGSVVFGRYTMAIGSNSCAEGLSTLASGAYSHSEGAMTTATGMESHAEGSRSIAKGLNSHAEGNGTIASGANQHVQGKFNIEDVNGIYADIVGNGTSSIPSNAYTLDWSGNGWYAGKLTVGINPINNMDVATKQYVDDSIPQPEDDIEVLNLLSQYGYSTPVSDIDGNVITDVDNNVILG